ncbi:MAG: hypothetical protein IJR68_04785 [Fretibacterium sp.]|nr:hypothetical protein [Fretibacterium sp.]
MAKRTYQELEAEFYEDFERPEVRSLIVGFAGLDPCVKGADGSGLTTDIVVDGGEI